MSIKKYFAGMFVAAGLACAMAVTSFAQFDSRAGEQSAEQVTNVTKRVSNTGRSTYAQPRGSLISSVTIGITKVDHGVAAVNGDIFCHEPMRKIRMVLYLQRWDESSKAWVDVESEELEWKAEDLPEGDDLTYAIAEIEIHGLKDGTYRGKGLFGASSYDKGTASKLVNTEGMEIN